jgi:hypothetical protein
MQLVKKIIIAAVIATASVTAFAESAGDAKVRAALEDTIDKVEDAIKFSEENGSNEAVIGAISNARQAQKEFRFEGTERQRQKANEKLRLARESFQQGNKAAGTAALKEVLISFNEMKKTYNLTHK